jgi:predicted dehydrogenase
MGTADKRAPEGRLGVALLGGGWVSLNRHLPAARRQPELELVGLLTKPGDLESIEREALTRKFGLRHFGESLSEPWFRDEVDAAVIGTPPGTHYELTMRCLGMGKHVLVEKPLAGTVEETGRMIEAARAGGLSLGVVHNFQFARAPSRAIGLYRAGRLGDLRALVGFQSSNHSRRLPAWYRELPLGLFTDESPHLLYLMLAFLTEASPRFIDVGPSMAPTDNTPTHVSAQFESKEGVPAALHMLFTGALSEWHLAVFGSERTVVVDLFRDLLVELPNDRRHDSLDVLRTSLCALGRHASGFASSGVRHVTGRMDYGNTEVFRRFTAAAIGGSGMPGIEAEAGQAVVRMMERINEAARSRPRPR